ncbi:hypothetical protein DUNSADRAFT_1163 [Dunaliella salina]|uniref:Encoded protein n=1 Tax=Dunaliella salina TaxID=3046 RepID=A0ABQ7GXF9_DUNSA|nr:hypothetical protein DUNSADRAFT_1163 [Dunaliella salina]|eukprot:KAF5839290.1 hypothetical protein DUNSADRAFT_1163 [Dunaliella salina]
MCTYLLLQVSALLHNYGSLEERLSSPAGADLTSCTLHDKAATKRASSKGLRSRTQSSPGEAGAPEDSAQPCRLLPKISAPQAGLGSLEGPLSFLADKDRVSCPYPSKALSLSHVGNGLLPAPPSEKRASSILKAHSTQLEVTEQHGHEGLSTPLSSTEPGHKGAEQPLVSPFNLADASTVPHLLSEPPHEQGKKRGARLTKVLSWKACQQSTSGQGWRHWPWAGQSAIPSMADKTGLHTKKSASQISESTWRVGESAQRSMESAPQARE